MTAKQKANQARFKKVVAEAKKLRAKNKKLTQAQAVKQAWAIMYSKTGTSKKIGALPIGFTGTFWGVKIKLVGTKVIDAQTDVQIVNFTGNKSDTKEIIEIFTSYILKNRSAFYSYDTKEFNQLKKQITSFCKNIQEEVSKENKINSKIKKVKTPKVKSVKEKKTVTKKVKKHHTHWGKVKAHERRISGVHKDTKSHNVNIRVMSGLGTIQKEQLEQIDFINKNIQKWRRLMYLLEDELYYAKTKNEKSLIKKDMKEAKYYLRTLEDTLKEYKKSIK